MSGARAAAEVPVGELVGRLIGDARQRRGWTQPQLTDRLATHRARTAVSGWERGMGVGFAALLELVGVMPELGDGLVLLIRRAQRR